MRGSSPHPESLRGGISAIVISFHPPPTIVPFAEHYSTLGPHLGHSTFCVFSETLSGLSWKCAWELRYLFLELFEPYISRYISFYFLATILLTGTALYWFSDILCSNNISYLSMLIIGGLSCLA